MVHGIIRVLKTIEVGGVNMKPSEQFRAKARKPGLYNIMPLSNIGSVLKYGILSNELAARLHHQSIAMQEVQTKRDLVQVPNGRMLHQYANLYFDARNPMMYVRKNEDICVLNVHPSVLDLENVVVSDCNAASNYARFYEASKAFDYLDYDLIYATVWRDEDYYEYCRKKSTKCAEVLVPEFIAPSFITAAAVKTSEDQERMRDAGFPHKIYIVPDLFFM